MNTPIPSILQPILQEYTSLVSQEIPGLVTAVGSIALDGFNPRLSDIDFVAILSRRASAEDQEKILALHKTIEQRHKQLENLNSYWASWTTRPDGILALLTGWGVQWTVLGVLRQFYTLREKQILSKTGAGEYALTCLPERWHPIIREALAMRETPRRSLYPSRLKRARETYSFIKGDSRSFDC